MTGTCPATIRMIRLFDDQSDAMSERDDLRVVPVQVARDLQYSIYFDMFGFKFKANHA